MDLQMPQIDGFLDYGNDQPSLLDTGDPPQIWQALDDDMLNLDDDWSDQNIGMSNIDHLCLVNIEDAAWPALPDLDFVTEDDDEADILQTSPTNTGIDEAKAKGKPENRVHYRRSKRLTQVQVACFEAWLSKHVSYPYPTENQKLELSAETNLSKKQVEQWFSRTRQRKIPKPEMNLPIRSKSLTSSAQPSLEVLPPHSAPSAPRSMRSVSDGASQTSLGTNLPPEQQLESFHGPMLSWWFDTVQEEPRNYFDRWIERIWPVRSCPRMDKKLQSIAKVLQDRFRIFCNIFDSEDRALLRLVNMLEIDLSSTQHRCLFNLCISFLMYNRSNAWLLVNMLNEIEFLPTAPLALSSLISQLRAFLEEDCDYPASTLEQMFLKSTEELSSEMAELYPRSTSNNSQLIPDMQLEQSTATAYSDYELRIVRRHNFDSSEGSSDSLEASLCLKGPSFEEPCFEESQSVASGSTADSSLSACSYTSLGSRRGRRRPAAHPPTSFVCQEQASASAPFQCMFCPKSFSRKFTWQRHEESVHVFQRVYVCSPRDFLSATSQWCPWCPGWESYSKRACSHACAQCWLRPVEERTFFRKDNLEQHFRNVHGADSTSFAIRNARWCEQTRVPTAAQLKCQICGYMSTSWKERVKHVAKHFKGEISHKKTPQRPRARAKPEFMRTLEVDNMSESLPSLQSSDFEVLL